MHLYKPGARRAVLANRSTRATVLTPHRPPATSSYSGAAASFHAVYVKVFFVMMP